MLTNIDSIWGKLEYLSGEAKNLYGNISNITGNISFLSGCCSKIHGDARAITSVSTNLIEIQNLIKIYNLHNICFSHAHFSIERNGKRVIIPYVGRHKPNKVGILQDSSITIDNLESLIYDGIKLLVC